jgi:hypothetical protein
MTFRSVAGAGGAIVIPPACQMISVAGPTAAGSNQVTQLVASASNPNGMRLITIYTQVIQNNNPNTNIAQSLIVAALTAPTDFNSKANCISIFRTYQDGMQTPVSLGGGSPTSIVNLELPAGWGIWQLLNVTGSALNRNNVRLAVVLY